MKDVEQGDYAIGRDACLRRLRRIEGQARGLQRMVEEEKRCIDILTQVSATTKALQAIALGLLEAHLRRSVTSAIEGDAEVGTAVHEASQAVAGLVHA